MNFLIGIVIGYVGMTIFIARRKRRKEREYLSAVLKAMNESPREVREQMAKTFLNKESLR